MIKLLLISLVAVAATEDCWVGDWTPWSECRKSTGTNVPQDYNPDSWRLAATEYDEGRLWMERMVAAKVKRVEKLKACRAEGSCPQFDVPPSRGPADCVDGDAAGYSCSQVNLLSFINVNDIGGAAYGPGAGGNDLWGWVDPMNNDEYAIMGLTTGTGFVKVTDPQSPKPVAFLPSTGNSESLWRDLKVIGHYVYIVAEASGHGIQVFDLDRLRAIDSPDVVYVESDAFYGNVGNSHNIVANAETGYIYAVGSTRQVPPSVTICSGGLHAVNVNDPLNPVYEGCFGGDGYTHDAECVVYRGPDSTYRGSEICFAYNEDTLTIVDASNKANMQLISKVTYPGARYTHQGWLTDDHAALLLDDELDEYYGVDKRTRTFFYDVSDLSDPILKTIFTSDEEALDHNQYIFEGHAYQSNYEAGLRILKIDQENFGLEEVAHFDTFPHPTEIEFQGTWSNYPYLPSGIVLVSTFDEGLFMLRFDKESSAQQESVQQRRRLVRGENCPAASQSRLC